MKLRKILIALFFSISFASPIFSQMRISSNIEEVTVYPTSARITRAALADIPKGENIIHIWDIEEIKDVNSLKIQIQNSKIEILEVSPKKSYLEKPQKDSILSPLYMVLAEIEDSLSWLREEIYVAQASEKLLNENRKMDNRYQSLEIEDIKLLADTYKTNLLENRRWQFGLKKTRDRLEQRKRDFKNEIATMQNEMVTRTPYIEIRLLSETDVDAESIRFSFLTRKARWKPVYDITSMSFGAALSIDYKAKISNNTTKDWENVNMILSSSTPVNTPQKPSFAPLFARFPRYIRDTIVSFDPEAYEEQLQIVQSLEGGYKPHTEVVRNPVGFAFRLDKKQTIHKGRQGHFIQVEQIEIPAEYQYWTYPEKKEQVFLLAKVVDYGKYNLVAGSANIFFDTDQVGTTYIKSSSVSDTLEILLGIAENIIVKKQRRDFNASKAILNSGKQSFFYDIKLRNNTPQTVTVQVIDQIPISTDKAIQVEILKQRKGYLNPKNGQLTWNIKLKPNSSHDIEFSYYIKSPKNKEVIRTTN